MPFSSQDQTRFNTDPEPIVRPSDGCRGDLFMRGNFLPGESGAFGRLEQLRFDPRPEFTPTPTNPTSNALLHFRDMHGDKQGDQLLHAAAIWSASLDGMARAGAYTQREAEHASAVLGRLARLGALVGV